jgi:hypothetical protein
VDRQKLTCQGEQESEVRNPEAFGLVDFKVVVHPPAPAGYVILVRSYDVVKKDVDEDAYERWLLEP